MAGAAGGVVVTGSQARQGFCVGNLNLMIRYADGSELTELPAVYRLPNVPRWFVGMANLHGALAPVFDPAHWFGVDRPAPSKPMLLVLGHGADAAGVVIDAMPERLRFDSDDLVDTATVPDTLAPIVQRAALIGGRVWFDLDSNALLAGFERALGTSP
jgi:twitching motility protein PilI